MYLNDKNLVLVPTKQIISKYKIIVYNRKEHYLLKLQEYIYNLIS